MSMELSESGLGSRAKSSSIIKQPTILIKDIVVTI